MDFKVEDIGPCRKKIAVTIAPERVREEYDSKYAEINDQVAMPGFRPGRTPRVLLERRFASRLGDEIKNDLVKAALEELFESKEHAIDPLAAPEIDVEALDFEPTEAFTFEFELVTKPNFETPAYKELEVKVPPIEVSDDELQEGIDRLRRRGASLETVEKGKVEDGDVLILDWKAMEGDSVEARDDGIYYPYGRGVVADFVAESIDEQLAGKAVGAEAKADVQVAMDDPREELRGKELELQVVLKEIKRYELPPIDAAFLEKNDFDDEAELKDDVKKQIQRAKARQRDAMAEELLVEQLLGSVEISLPEDFVERELENWAVRKRMSMQMEKAEDEAIAKEIESARDDTKAAIETDMQRFFMLDRIAEAEDIEVTEGEMVQAVQEIAMAYGHPIEQVMTQFRDGGRLQELQSQIRHRKARAAIRATATLVEDPSMLDDDGADKKAAKKKPAKKKAAKKKAAKKKASK
ncbi:MAG: trigger factor [Planctomycetota bacterium]|nr:trigger factor [Planctomycetota bacterium]